MIPRVTKALNELSRSNSAGAHCRNRMFEWATTAMMLGIAVCLIATPKTIELGAFRFLLDAGLTSGRVAVLLLAVGVLRAVSLYLNGLWQPWGARSRAFGALVGSVMWLQLTIALVLLTEITGTLSIGIPVYAALTVGEMISCHRAAADEIRRDSA